MFTPFSSWSSWTSKRLKKRRASRREEMKRKTTTPAGDNYQFSFPRLRVVPQGHAEGFTWWWFKSLLASHEFDGVRKEKERLTAAQLLHHESFFWSSSSFSWRHLQWFARRRDQKMNELLPGGYILGQRKQGKGMLELLLNGGWTQRMIRGYTVNLHSLVFHACNLLILSLISSSGRWLLKPPKDKSREPHGGCQVNGPKVAKFLDR